MLRSSSAATIGHVGKQRRAYLHVGLDDGSGAVLDDALSAHEHALLDLHVRRPADAPATFRAALDVLDLHGDWGYDRDEVDGAWADLVTRARKGRDTIVVSQSLLARAAAPTPAASSRPSTASTSTPSSPSGPRARLPAGGSGRDLTEVLPRWAGAVGAPDRVHVLLGDPAATWRGAGPGRRLRHRLAASPGRRARRPHGPSTPPPPPPGARCSAPRRTTSSATPTCSPAPPRRRRRDPRPGRGPRRAQPAAPPLHRPRAASGQGREEEAQAQAPPVRAGLTPPRHPLVECVTRDI